MSRAPKQLRLIDRPVILGTGSRTYADRYLVGMRLDLAAEFLGGDVCVMQGDHYEGADPLIRAHAIRRGWPVLDRPADWLAPCRATCPPVTAKNPWGHRRLNQRMELFCPAAGPYRNEEMVEECAESFYPVLVLAFFSPGSRGGTAGCVKLAKAAQLRVDRVGLDPHAEPVASSRYRRIGPVEFLGVPEWPTTS